MPCGLRLKLAAMVLDVLCCRSGDLAASETDACCYAQRFSGVIRLSVRSKYKEHAATQLNDQGAAAAVSERASRLATQTSSISLALGLHAAVCWSSRLCTAKFVCSRKTRSPPSWPAPSPAQKQGGPAAAVAAALARRQRQRSLSLRCCHRRRPQVHQLPVI